ncbi:MAG: hypothetical protein Q9171_000013 [Xanthocarpia ochracea]
MTSLSILRCYLIERPTLRNWRVTIMMLMGTMMLVAIALSSTHDWAMNISCPAQCLFDQEKRDLSFNYPYFIALTIHYSTSIWRVYDTQRFDRFFLTYPRERLQKIVRGMKRTNSNASTITQHTTAAAAFTFNWFSALTISCYLAVAAILGSLTISLYYDIVWFTLGFMSILQSRQVPASSMDGSENELSFGQIVPVLLLASIILIFKEVYTGTYTHEPLPTSGSPEARHEYLLNSNVIMQNKNSDGPTKPRRTLHHAFRNEPRLAPSTRTS